jgi:hypothetical protein
VSSLLLLLLLLHAHAVGSYDGGTFRFPSASYRRPMADAPSSLVIGVKSVFENRPPRRTLAVENLCS